MGKNTDTKIYSNLLKTFIVIALVGIVALLYASLTNDPTEVVFSLIAFMISVAALIMTTLQSISINRQLHITERAMELMRQADSQLEVLVDEDKKLNEEIHQDLVLDRRIVEILEEVGVGASAEERREVASRIAERIHAK